MSIDNTARPIRFEDDIIEEILLINSLILESPRKARKKASKLLKDASLSQKQVAWASVLLARAQFKISNEKSEYVTHNLITAIDKMSMETKQSMYGDPLLFFESYFLQMAQCLWASECPRKKWKMFFFNNYEEAAEKHKEEAASLAKTLQRSSNGSNPGNRGKWVNLLNKELPSLKGTLFDGVMSVTVEPTPQEELQRSLMVA